MFSYLLHGYDPSVRPVHAAVHPVVIQIGLTLTHIFNIDEKSQVLALNVWVEQTWKEERFYWEPSDYGNITKLTIPMALVWVPDVVLENNARDFSRSFVETNLHASSDGMIQWAPPQKVFSRCHMDVSRFMFDEQFCSLIFRSWIYDRSQLHLEIVERYDGKAPFTRDSFTENGEWQIVANRTFHYVQTINGFEYDTVIFEIHLRRRILYFMYNIVAPCVMLSILTLMQFMLPCESGERVTLGLTVLLAYSVFSFNIAENMPETSEVIPLIALYLMAIMAISALAVGLSVLVLNMRHGAESGTKVPRWLHVLGFEILGKVFGGKGKVKFGELNYAKLRMNGIRNEIVRKILDEESQEESSAKWTEISLVFDRFFFCLVLVLTAASTLYCLVIAPNIGQPNLQARKWEH